jgi:hypothetical protein
VIRAFPSPTISRRPGPKVLRNRRPQLRELEAARAQRRARLYPSPGKQRAAERRELYTQAA